MTGIQDILKAYTISFTREEADGLPIGKLYYLQELKDEIKPNDLVSVLTDPSVFVSEKMVDKAFILAMTKFNEDDRKLFFLNMRMMAGSNRQKTVKFWMDWWNENKDDIKGTS